jgi:ABC-2 type transport system permease protein
MTAPVKIHEMVIGKFLSTMMFLGVLLLATTAYPIILAATGNPEIKPILSAYLGTFLIGGSFLAIGILFSSMTENQIIAGVLTFATLIFFWLISWASHSAGPAMSEFLNYLSLIGHYQNFARGIINTSDVVFYLSYITVSLFLTHRILDSYRWRA